MKKFLTETEAVNYCGTLSINELTKLCGKLIFESQGNKINEKITVTQEHYDSILSMLKIRGIRDDGEKETRGRKRIKVKIVA